MSKLVYLPLLPSYFPKPHEEQISQAVLSDTNLPDATALTPMENTTPPLGYAANTAAAGSGSVRNNPRLRLSCLPRLPVSASFAADNEDRTSQPKKRILIAGPRGPVQFDKQDIPRRLAEEPRASSDPFVQHPNTLIETPRPPTTVSLPTMRSPNLMPPPPFPKRILIKKLPPPLSPRGTLSAPTTPRAADSMHQVQGDSKGDNAPKVQRQAINFLHAASPIPHASELLTARMSSSPQAVRETVSSLNRATSRLVRLPLGATPRPGVAVPTVEGSPSAEPSLGHIPTQAMPADTDLAAPIDSPYKIPKNLLGCKTAMGEHTWDAYVKLMEDFIDEVIGEDQLKRESNKLFQMGDEAADKTLMNRVKKMVEQSRMPDEPGE